MRRYIFALSVLLSAGPASASCVPAAQPVKDYLAKHPAWHIVNLADLGPEDTDLWRKYRGKACPGQAQADLKGDGHMSYGLTLLSKEGLRWVIILNDDGIFRPTLIGASKWAGADVVHTGDPGPDYEVETRRRVDIKHQSLVFEHLESGATIYYWDKGKLAKLQISE